MEVQTYGGMRGGVAATKPVLSAAAAVGGDYCVCGM